MIMEKLYILVEDDRHIIFISDKEDICQFFKDRYHALFGNLITLEVKEVDFEYINLGCVLDHKFYYINRKY